MFDDLESLSGPQIGFIFFLLKYAAVLSFQNLFVLQKTVSSYQLIIISFLFKIIV